MRSAHCDRPSLQHAAVLAAAGLSAPVVATAVPLDVTTSIAIIVVGTVAAVVVVVVVVVVVGVAAGTEGSVAAGIVSSASVGSRKTLLLRWPRAWRPLAATLLTRAHLPPRGDIAPAITCARSACSEKETRPMPVAVDHATKIIRTDIPVDPDEPTLLVRASERERARARAAHPRRAGIAYNRAMTERTAATRPSKAGAGTRRL